MLNPFRAGRRVAVLFALAAIFGLPSQATAQRVSVTIPAVSAAPAAAMPTGQPGITPVPTGVTAPAVESVARPLRDLVASFVNVGNHDEEQLCLAKAVYFEARGETLEGQLAVAEVVLNRAASGRYPPTICAVVTQRAQFSFIRGGRFPAVNVGSSSWHIALAIADIARKNLADQIPARVLWYHASYVSPSWGRRLTRVTRIGAHIFYG